MKKFIPYVPCHKIYRVDAAGLSFSFFLFFFLPRVETRGIIEARDSAPVTETKSM